MRRSFVPFLVLGLVFASVSASAETTTVLLVRHAEKAATGGPDPELSDEGRATAERLLTALQNVDLAAIYSTPFKRTRDTAGPIAREKGLDVSIVEVGPGFVEKLAERILAENKGSTVLVVGHSNTLGPTIAALGGGETFELDESEYGDLFVCTIPDDGTPVLLRLRF